MDTPKKGRPKKAIVAPAPAVVEPVDQLDMFEGEGEPAAQPAPVQAAQAEPAAPAKTTRIADMPKLNVAFSDDELEYLRRIAGVTGHSINSYLRLLVSLDRDENIEKLQQLEEASQSLSIFRKKK